MDPEIAALAIQFAAAAGRNTAQSIAERIHAAKTRRQDEQTIAEMDDIIRELIKDKAEIVGIAQAYEAALVAQRISDDDVSYITSSMVPMIENLAKSSLVKTDGDVDEVLDLIKPIISAEAIKVLQLIGFDFRKAIGQPLTDLVARAIASKSAPSADDATSLESLRMRQTIVIYEVAQDKDACDRLDHLLGR